MSLVFNPYLHYLRTSDTIASHMIKKSSVSINLKFVVVQRAFGSTLPHFLGWSQSISMSLFSVLVLILLQKAAAKRQSCFQSRIILGGV